MWYLLPGAALVLLVWLRFGNVRKLGEDGSHMDGVDAAAIGVECQANPKHQTAAQAGHVSDSNKGGWTAAAAVLRNSTTFPIICTCGALHARAHPQLVQLSVLGALTGLAVVCPPTRCGCRRAAAGDQHS